MTPLNAMLPSPPVDAVAALASLQTTLRDASEAWLARAMPAIGTAPLPTLRALREDVARVVRGAQRAGVPPLMVRRMAGNVVAGALPLGTRSDVAEAWALAARRLVDEIYLLGEHLG
jgi:hypothetical protein